MTVDSFDIDDACGLAPPHHEHGLRRLRDAGITVTSVKGVFYEWVSDLETYRRLKPKSMPPCRKD